MANEINRLIEMLYEKVEDARSVTLQPGLCKLERDEMLDLLDELKAQIPGEIKRAQELLSAREKFIDDAKREAERIVRDAETEAKKKISNSEVSQTAREEARKILEQAEDNSRQLLQVATEYAEDVMNRTVEFMQTGLDNVTEAHKRFRQASMAKMQETRDRLLSQAKPQPKEEE